MKKKWCNADLAEPFLGAEEAIFLDKLEVKSRRMTPEQREAMFIQAWCTNPYGNFRRRMVSVLAQEGLAKIVDDAIQFDISYRDVQLVVNLFELVNGDLNEEFDDHRTMATYTARNSIH
jgi:hypothetical protein